MCWVLVIVQIIAFGRIMVIYSAPELTQLLADQLAKMPMVLVRLIVNYLIIGSGRT